MLVLSRRRNQSIVIQDDIVVTVVETRGSTVRLGITAPKHLPVHRHELYEKIRRNEEQPKPEFFASPG